MTGKHSNPLLPMLEATIDRLMSGFEAIPPGRKKLLAGFAAFIGDRFRRGEVVDLNFICTHNSRRSHMAQLWAQAAAHYFGVSGVRCFSGGTVATVFNERAVKAMREAGFNIVQPEPGENSAYEVHFAEGAAPVIAFSKRYDDPFNPSSAFAAVMTCSQADADCPIMPGALVRFAISYEDPKAFDQKPQEEAVYRERVDQIGTEMLYAFSLVG